MRLAVLESRAAPPSGSQLLDAVVSPYTIAVGGLVALSTAVSVGGLDVAVVALVAAGLAGWSSAWSP